MKKLSKIEVVCLCVIFGAILLCLAFCFLYVYFEEPVISLNGDKDVVVELNGKYDDKGAKAYLNKKDISKNIKVTKNVNLKKVGSYKIVYSVTNSKGKKRVSVVRNVRVLDNVKPVLKLKKGSSYSVQFGSSYADPGYSATDNYDGDITSSVLTKGSVNTKKLGSYKISYSVVDSSFNKVTKVRTVKVVDEVSPKITINGDKNTYVPVGKEYIDAGCKAIDNYDGDVSSRVKFNGNVNTSVPGFYTVSYSVKDSFGNYSYAERSVQVGTQKQIDVANHISVSIKEQKLWYYKNGKLVITSNVVTGLRGSHDTITGNFRIRNKNRDTYLIGDDYKSFVNYWMLIDYGTQIGLHDATWRSNFGGNIYAYNGSHGCINLPYYVAEVIYNKAGVGTLVTVF